MIMGVESAEIMENTFKKQNANPNAKDALPLKFREIEICDSSDDSVKKIIVLCSEMYT
jgi:hypothetical protein